MFKYFINFEINYNYDFISCLCDIKTRVTVKYTCKILKGHSSMSKASIMLERNDKCVQVKANLKENKNIINFMESQGLLNDSVCRK